MTLNAQSKVNFLINQTFSSKIGSTCEEVIGDDSCAGSEIYLTLKFSEETVSIIEKEITSCDEEHISFQQAYKWTLINDSEIKIGNNSKEIAYHFLKNLILKAENKTIVGYKEISTKQTDKFEFKKQL